MYIYAFVLQLACNVWQFTGYKTTFSPSNSFVCKFAVEAVSFLSQLFIDSMNKNFKIFISTGNGQLSCGSMGTGGSIRLKMLLFLDTFLESLGSFSVRNEKRFFFFFINDPTFFSCTNVFNTNVLVHFWLFKTDNRRSNCLWLCWVNMYYWHSWEYGIL